ncbi:mannose-6-phosphate isomerase [Acetobacter sp. DmW_043]|uniref:AGE family epimerase/isomerase n=1 Tax=Acetobacter sp. DmW_043 TaxID=1670658 RepID=UPI000A3757A5|nr:AGE family epimerase/isomerase [Acetobacter sp. DmW_043]OUI89573.1 mannose-6-phosphate isomerase [Acetobacter sp. DmW_043]
MMQHISEKKTEPLLIMHQRFTNWLFDEALPFWATAGCDGTPENPALYGAQESLTLEGVSAQAPFKRVRVQARQLFVFSWAALQGQAEGRSRADGIFAFLCNAHNEQGKWGRSLTPEGQLLDPTADLYDLAFVIFALAWYERLDQSGKALALARQALRWISENMSTPQGGFFNTLPAGDEPRQQNPHMHLFEAILALYETTGEIADLTQAHALYALFSQFLQDETTGTLGEYFTSDWAPAPGHEGNWLEPGHHFEWVWLLSEYERLTGVITKTRADRLYQFAKRYGPDPATGLVCDALGRDGSVLKASSRLWVQGETLRAVLTVDPQDTDGLAARIVTNLLERYFTDCPAGTWHDQLNEAAYPVSKAIPASSLYHIITAYDVLNKVRSEVTQ